MPIVVMTISFEDLFTSGSTWANVWH